MLHLTLLNFFKNCLKIVSDNVKGEVVNGIVIMAIVMI